MEDFNGAVEEIKGENKYDIRAGIQDKQTVFKTKPLEALRKKKF